MENRKPLDFNQKVKVSRSVAPLRSPAVGPLRGGLRAEPSEPLAASTRCALEYSKAMASR